MKAASMTEGKMKTCPICKLKDDKIAISKVDDWGRKLRINCPRCKEFTITHMAEILAPDLEKLSAWIRNRNEQNAEVPEIDQKSLEDIQVGLPNYNPREKQTILLQNIERKTLYPGKPVQIVSNYDIPLAWASTKEEFLYYIDSLIERGLIRRTDRVDKSLDELTFFVAITANGWDYLEQHDRRIEARTKVFVAMSFSESLKSIWEGPISRAIKKAGYKPYRVDAEPHIDRIDAKIISEIKDSRFVVADVTDQKRGVYFEAGYALGLGLRVIWCVKKDELKDVHFDTRQYNHIDWETENDLETRLYDFICAIIGKGKEA